MMNKTSLRIGAIVISSALVYLGLTFCIKSEPIDLLHKLAAVGLFDILVVGLWCLEAHSAKGGPVKTRGGNKSGFDWGMHYFRAFAILVIMATHYAFVFDYGTLCQVAFTSSTIYFLFISGYLCQYIDARRRESPASYYRKKFLNVILPFLLFSVGFEFLRGMFGFNVDCLLRILLGDVQAQYWYIPFVTLLFLLSPSICRMGNKSLMALTVMSFALFLMFPFRPFGFAIAWPHTFYLYTYFTFFYIIGFVYCRFKESIDNEIKSYWPLFLLGALLLLLLLWKPELVGLNCTERGLAIAMQRFMVLLCVLVGLRFLRDKHILILDLLAKYSFTLYFIHFGVFSMSRPIHDWIVAHVFLPLVLSECLVFLLYVGMMLCAAIIFKTVFGKYSRSFLGS